MKLFEVVSYGKKRMKKFTEMVQNAVEDAKTPSKIEHSKQLYKYIKERRDQQ
jgi:hypothetical protein